MKELFLRPGKVAREFNAGKRKKYFNPITYLLIVMALQIYLSQKTGIMDFYVEEIQTQGVTEIKAGSEAEYKKITEVVKTAQQQIQEHGKVFNLLFLPILAFLTWIFFKRTGNNYAEILVFDVMYMAQVLLIFVMLCIIPFLIYPGSAVITLNLYGITVFVYMIIGMKQFFNQSWIATILKAIAIQLLYYITMFIIVLIVVAYLLL
jgi:Protein of unknown function (DUF3667)